MRTGTVVGLGLGCVEGGRADQKIGIGRGNEKLECRWVARLLGPRARSYS